MLHTALVAIAAFLFTSAASWADEGPRVTPARDVAVLYRITAPDKTAETVRVSYAGGGHKARLDFFADSGAAAPYGSTIVDQDSNRVLLLLPARHGYVEQEAGPARALAFPLDADMRFSGGKRDVVIGQPCREWTLAGTAGMTGTACVTEDGVLLRGVRTAPTAGTIEAVSIDYAAQPAELFVPPQDYVKLIRVPRRQNP